MIGKNGLFVNYPEGLNGHNRDEVILWRLVIDQSLRDAISANTSASRLALQWVSARAPGCFTKVYEDWEQEDGRIKYNTFEVDLHEEFCSVCEMAGLDPDFVRTKWFEAYHSILNDDLEKKEKKKKKKLTNSKVERKHNDEKKH